MRCGSRRRWEARSDFSKRSAQLYDSGQEDESLRLATTMRVVFHETPNSTSLLTHMQLTGTKMLSSARGHGDWQDYLGHKIDLDESAADHNDAPAGPGVH